MDLQWVAATLDEAVQKGLIAIRDIAGRGSWKGMDLTLQNRTWFKGVDVTIPAGTLFVDKKNALQKMMTLSNSNVYVGAGSTVTHPLDDATCTEPHAPAPPPRTRQISEAMREAALMSDQEFESRLGLLMQLGRINGEQAEDLREDRQFLLKNELVMQAIRKGDSEARYRYAYSAVPPSALTAGDKAEALLGIGVNMYKYGDKNQALDTLREASEAAPATLRPYYQQVYDFAQCMNQSADAPSDLIHPLLMMACGSQDMRWDAEWVIDETLNSPVSDREAAFLHAALGLHMLLPRLADAALNGTREYPESRINAMGRAAERAALEMMKWRSDSHVTDLNPDPSTAKSWGYDAASDERVISVKCRLDSPDPVPEYTRDLRFILGISDPAKAKAAALRLHERAKDQRDGFPPEVAESPEAAEIYLRSRAELWLPEDHARMLIQRLRSVLLAKDASRRQIAAQNVGLLLAANTYERDVETLLARIRGIGMTSYEVRGAMQKQGFAFEPMPGTVIGSG